MSSPIWERSIEGELLRLEAYNVELTERVIKLEAIILANEKQAAFADRFADR